MTTVSLVAELDAVDGAGDRVARLLADYGRTVQGDDETIVFAAHRRTDDPRRFVVYEVYQDEAGFRRHLERPANAAFNAAVAGLLEGGESRLVRLGPPLN